MSTNESEARHAWESIEAGHGMIALTIDSIKAQNLPPSLEHFSLPGKMIYGIEGYHAIHCLVRLSHLFPAQPFLIPSPEIPTNIRAPNETSLTKILTIQTEDNPPPLLQPPTQRTPGPTPRARHPLLRLATSTHHVHGRHHHPDHHGPRGRRQQPDSPVSGLGST